MNLDDLLLISVGGAAARITQRIVDTATVPMRVLILDTDDAILQTLTPQAGVSTMIIGAKRLEGRGTGGDHSLGSGALRDDASNIMTQIGTPRLAIVLTCCGGGTSGATTHLLRLLREHGIATATFATIPFVFEGDDRRRCANIVLPTLESGSDALTRIALDSLLDESQRNVPVEQAFEFITRRLSMGLALFWQLLSSPGFVAFDSEHFHRLLTQGSTTSLHFSFADASATGDARAECVLRELLNSPRFQGDGANRLENAAQVLVGVLAGKDLRLCELSILMDGLREHCKALKETFLGTTCAEHFDGRLTVVLLAFGTPPVDVTNKGSLGPIKRPAKTGRATKLGTTRNRFEDVEHTLYDGHDLDVPTYQRRGIRLTR